MVGNMNFGHVFFCHLKGGKLVGFQENIYMKKPCLRVVCIHF